MSINNAKTSLKILGILSIILSIPGLLFGIGLFSGSKIITENFIKSGSADAGSADEVFALTGLMIVAGIFVLVSAIVDLLLGIFSVRGAKDASKIKPAYVLSIVALVLSLISLIVDFAVNTSVSTILDGAAGIVIAIVIFWCANTIRKNA